jgi:hypothetical protein
MGNPAYGRFIKAYYTRQAGYWQFIRRGRTGLLIQRC